MYFGFFNCTYSTAFNFFTVRKSLSHRRLWKQKAVYFSLARLINSCASATVAVKVFQQLHVCLPAVLFGVFVMVILGVFTTTKSMVSSASITSKSLKVLWKGIFPAPRFLVLSHTPYNSNPSWALMKGAWNTQPLIPKEHNAVLIFCMQLSLYYTNCGELHELNTIRFVQFV